METKTNTLPTITHPTIGSGPRPNFTEVTIGAVVVWFSYSTPIGFMAPGFGRVVRENEWGPTTGKHMNYIDGGKTGRKDDRVSAERFAELLDSALDN